MKRNVLVFASISSLLITIWLIVFVTICYNNPSYEGSMVMGYSAMLLAFSLIFPAVKNYRDKYNGGVITFGKAFQLAIYITLITCGVYVVVWLIEYYCFIPDFMDHYAAHMIRQAQNSHYNAAQMAEKVKEINKMKDLYKSPLMVALFTFMEPFPPGLIVSLIAAAVLMRKKPKGEVVVA